jgi:hypothetical protein
MARKQTNIKIANSDARNFTCLSVNYAITKLVMIPQPQKPTYSIWRIHLGAVNKNLIFVSFLLL